MMRESETLCRIHMSEEAMRPRGRDICPLWELHLLAVWLQTHTYRLPQHWTVMLTKHHTPNRASLSFFHSQRSICQNASKGWRPLGEKMPWMWVCCSCTAAVSYWSYGLLRAPEHSSDLTWHWHIHRPEKSALFFAESDIRFTWHCTCSGQKSKCWYSSISIYVQQTVRLYSPASSDHTHNGRL